MNQKSNQEPVAHVACLDPQIIGQSAPQAIAVMMQMCVRWSQRVWSDFEARCEGKKQLLQGSAAVAYVAQNPNCLNFNSRPIVYVDTQNSFFDDSSIRRWSQAYCAINKDFDVLGFKAMQEGFSVSDIGAICALGAQKCSEAENFNPHVLENIFEGRGGVFESLRVQKIQECWNILFVNLAAKDQSNSELKKNEENQNWDNWRREYIDDYIKEFYTMCVRLNWDKGIAMPVNSADLWDAVKKSNNTVLLDSVSTPGHPAHEAFINTLALELWVGSSFQSPRVSKEISKKSIDELVEKSRMLSDDIKGQFISSYQAKLLTQSIKNRTICKKSTRKEVGPNKRAPTKVTRV